jgi:hypothetical protein
MKEIPTLKPYYGKYKTTDKIHRKGYYWHVECECACGEKKLVKVENLLRGQSLGCHQCRSEEAAESRKGFKNQSWKGYGELSGWFFHKFERGAKRREISFSTTIKDCWELFIKQQKKCALSGIPIELCKRSNNQGSLDATASLDRIDSLKGYENGNVQWVHKTVNKMKNDIKQEVFLDFCRKISKMNKV